MSALREAFCTPIAPPRAVGVPREHGGTLPFPLYVLLLPLPSFCVSSAVLVTPVVGLTTGQVRGGQLLCMDYSRSLEPVERSTNPTSCEASERTIDARGLAPHQSLACTGMHPP